ncbi:MAG TPA: ABC transporter ATP-binding protein [Dermatophilaceae bacterium]|nr:ABC transporter ATP-binding protein [Dermatophilaceae bacterium]
MTTQTTPQGGDPAVRPGIEGFLQVKDLRVHFPTDDGVVKSVDGLSFNLERGETLGIVGESGSGKSVTSLSIMGLHPPGTATISGQVVLNGDNLIGASREHIRRLRGKDMAMIFQDPLSAMHPYYTVGHQIIEAYRVHNNVSKQVARKHAIDMLDRVGIPQPGSRVDEYPHQFSGGMRQRAMIAMALSCDPELLIADEPTTALDVTVQAQIMELLKAIQQRTGAALLLITHDLGVIAEMVEQVIVMYAGQIVEQGTVHQVLLEPRMPYTMGLIESIPTVEKRGGKLSAIKGVVPSPFNLPPNCRFEPRCPYTWALCRSVPPELYPAGEIGQVARCHLHLAGEAARRDAAIRQHDENLRLGRRLTGAPDRLGDA